MRPKVQTLDVDHFQKLGVTFLPSFLAGAVGVKARYDLPRLFYPSTMSPEQVEHVLDKVNANLKGTYRGYGCYRHCPQSEMQSGGEHVLVLFADDDFYADYLGNDMVAGG